jgi:hypothetical protein
VINYRLIAIASVALGILLTVDGIYMVAVKYNQGETQMLNLPDGWIVIISAGILFVVAIIAFVLAARSPQAARSTPAARSEVEAEKG